VGGRPVGSEAQHGLTSGSLTGVRLVLANHSSYPRVGEGAQAQRVRRAYAKRETGAIDDAGYLEVARDYIAEIVRDQEAASLDIVTDGQVHWYDAVSHLARPLQGAEIGGLHRFFDTNYLVRQPEITGKLGGSIGLADDFSYAAGVAKAEVKAVVTGPYTLARYSIIKDSSYDDVGQLAMGYAERLAGEVTALAKAGCTLIQIEEPSLLQAPEDAELVRHTLLRTVADKGNARISLVTYFGDATQIWGELLNMPAEILGFDLTYGPGVAGLIGDVDRPVALGAIDGRNTKLDDTQAVARTVERVMEALGSRGVDEIHLQPSCGLEYLPRDRAQRKLERMRDIREAISGKVNA
jgi:5-methyltetrahydropteroyltriglutamate--homocysteine methyltransferase